MTFRSGKHFTRRQDRRRHSPALDINDRRQSERRKNSMEWIPLFRGVEQKAILEIIEECPVLQIEAGLPVLEAGTINESVFILLRGEVAVHLNTNIKSSPGIAIYAGECFGELSAIDGKPVSALVLALTEIRVLRLPKELFWERLMTLPGLASNLMVTLTERMRRSSQVALQLQREQLELLHVKKELDVARKLQVSMLPLQKPLFTDRKDIEICGFMEPATEVGGDLFDCFFVDEETLFICIGDVSGHGIAAAMFMARVISLIRVLAMNTLQPETVLSLLNDRLCIGNEANIFVTMFCAYLNVRTGELAYSNGGHCAPILSSEGRAGFIEIPKGALIGAFEGIAYKSIQTRLVPGDILFCYTDGITEARNNAGEELSEETCLSFVENLEYDALPALLDQIREKVAAFTGMRILEDDCTMLALRLLDPQQTQVQ